MTKGNVLFVLKLTHAIVMKHLCIIWEDRRLMFWKHCRLNSAESEIDTTQRDRGTQYERV